MSPTQHHTEYASPVLRAPSPASSVGTAYAEDQTSISDSEHQLSQAAFEKKWEERLELGKPRQEEEMANISALIPRPPSGSPEEKFMYDHIITSLRSEVHQLEENELFEQMLLRGSQAALERQPSTTDIDALMQSMMVTPQHTTIGPQPNRHLVTNITNGPWSVNRYESRGTGETILTSGIKVGKRSRNGSSRNFAA